ncbi:MAG TPA: hypothetical protein PKK00_03755 [Bacteroidales bacterium]|nr:hypothetical protein [Bacteroidales bacterium]HPS16580.1 hypothetical protein [Bacteroidales bacterium]
MLGNKQFELSNLPIAIGIGNVLTTVSDHKLPHSSNSTTIDYYTADITSAQDYYPFGMLMPGRNFSSNSYRFGFNGQENDNEISGVVGANTTAMYWEYDSRLGRRWNLDPKPRIFEAPYVAFGNNPNLYNDILGDTIKKSSAFQNDKTAMNAYKKWEKSEAGKKFISQYDIGGEFESTTINFDVGTEHGGECVPWTVNKSGKKRLVSPTEYKSMQSEGADMTNYATTMQKGDYLQFDILLPKSSSDKPYPIFDDIGETMANKEYTDVVGGLTLVHESQHVRLMQSWLKNPNYEHIFNAGCQHSIMKTDEVYWGERAKYLIENKASIIMNNFYSKRSFYEELKEGTFWID